MSFAHLIVAPVITASVLASVPPAGKDAGAQRRAEEEAYGRRVLREFAECVVDKHRDAAREFVLMPADGWLESDKFKKVTDSRCLGFLSGKLRARREQHRAAFAQRLIDVEYKIAPAMDPATVPAFEWPVPAAARTTDRKTGEPLTGEALARAQEQHRFILADRYLGQLGECVVRRDPAGSHALLVTRIGDTAELEAFRALSPVIPACIPKGETLSLSRHRLRDAMAISYYRIAAAAAPAGAQR